MLPSLLKPPFGCLTVLVSCGGEHLSSMVLRAVFPRSAPLGLPFASSCVSLLLAVICAPYRQGVRVAAHTVPLRALRPELTLCQLPECRPVLGVSSTGLCESGPLTCATLTLTLGASSASLLRTLRSRLIGALTRSGVGKADAH